MSLGRNIIPPEGHYETFEDENHFTEKLKEWGLTSKKQFFYKSRTSQHLVTIKGYEVYGNTAEFNTIIIEFDDGSLSTIHPAYLKEMQASSFGKTLISDIGDPSNTPIAETPKTKEKKEELVSIDEKPKEVKKDKKEKAPKLELPEEKVHFTAEVKQFALSWNHFNEEHDEVVVLKDVIIHQEESLEVGLAWCAHSKTLKKFELAVGDSLEFDGKIVKKKLPKGKDVEEEFIINDPVPYKVNNPSKIKKS
ncbi:hypothetical protein [Litchfieldia alkalitelluris]|uniref:hypothetical protein n=1 Tax=Litchfieldia alkalitelluris TaxID=304268 RepID=UPI000998803D|nr:hypothetical protein [Litchfieldia alkalitelluris]